MANSRDGIPGHTDIPRNGWDLLGMHNFRTLLGHFLGWSPQKLLFLWQCWVFGEVRGGKAHHSKVSLCMARLKSTQKRPPLLRTSSVLHLHSNSETKCYNFKDCYPLYIHPPPPPKKMHATFYFRTKKRRNKKVNNFKSHLSVGFFTRNYTCLA